MENSFLTWENFVENFNDQISNSYTTFEQMKHKGLVDYTYITFDFNFESDKKENLTQLSDFFEEYYPYSDLKITKEKEIWELQGVTNPIPVTSDLLTFWVLDMYKRGYEFDCELTGYGGLLTPNSASFPDLAKEKQKEYCIRAEKCYETNDISGALINWTIAIAIDPNDENSYHWRAMAKEDISLRQSAIEDYNKAIEINPNAIYSYINRGAIQDDFELYQDAITDYNKAIELSYDNAESSKMAYSNRGNTKYNMDDFDGACADWKKAAELGDEYAKDRLEYFLTNEK